MSRISPSTWAEIRTAYASGIGLRELARNMGIPAGRAADGTDRETEAATDGLLMEEMSPDSAAELSIKLQE